MAMGEKPNDAPCKIDNPKSHKQLGTNSNSNDDGVATITRIASSSISDKNELRAFRCGTRRERPPKLRIPPNNIHDDEERKGAAVDAHPNIFEADIESFVSSCIPASFVAGEGGNDDDENDDDDDDDARISQRRTKLIRKRSLPLLSFLSSTHLAAAEKKRRKEERDRQNSIAEAEAKKALLLNPINPAFESEFLDRDEIPVPDAESREMGRRLENESCAAHRVDVTARENSEIPEVNTPTVTITMENTSNILMPPLLRGFLD
eukprot:CAMPEP_0196138150 /NCGR_PEP_ID=MMETSP0910-20130528/5891_1 /TAXON_ID=49265 /ORGANISM="Thalassiosira rotula, Strain GSO102" /LENGTH=262 /DNA_ID=CAMNT_0041398713 /DNA_START=22 /DNA_END=807 /DNA_ORIENTATION=+